MADNLDARMRPLSAHSGAALSQRLSRPAAWACPEARSLRLAIRCQLRWAQMAKSAKTLPAESATLLVTAATPRIFLKFNYRCTIV